LRPNARNAGTARRSVHKASPFENTSRRSLTTSESDYDLAAMVECELFFMSIWMPSFHQWRFESVVLIKWFL
jgi:hypothetical protein